MTPVSSVSSDGFVLVTSPISDLPGSGSPTSSGVVSLNLQDPVSPVSIDLGVSSSSRSPGAADNDSSDSSIHSIVSLRRRLTPLPLRSLGVSRRSGGGSLPNNFPSLRCVSCRKSFPISPISPPSSPGLFSGVPDKDDATFNISGAVDETIFSEQEENLNQTSSNISQIFSSLYGKFGSYREEIAANSSVSQAVRVRVCQAADPETLGELSCDLVAFTIESVLCFVGDTLSYVGSSFIAG